MPYPPRSWGRTAGLLLVLALVVAGFLAVVPQTPSLSGPRAIVTTESARDPYLWPFSPESIWNLPIGANAVYVPARIAQATAYGMTTDPDVLILTPTAPSTAVYQNNDGWSGGSRCNAQGGLLFNGPIPSDFVVPGAGSGNPDGTTPNYATAILMPDNHTLAQGQPMARCTAGTAATMRWYQMNEDLYGLGSSGAHGGSMLSSIGGTIRLGELVPGGVIHHVLKVNLFGAQDYYYNASTKGYRWPATTADSYAASVYGGSVPALRMGSLLGLPPGLNVTSMGLETEPAKILAHAFQDYGAYTVDDTGWSVYAIETEFSPSGKVEDEFQNAWGFSMRPSSKSTPWARDMDRIFGNLSVVDNWDAATWSGVAASNGTEGAGGGAPRAPWAPAFGAAAPTPHVYVLSPPTGTTVNPGQRIAFSWSSSGPLQPNSVSLSFSSNGGTTWDAPFATGQPLNGSVSWQAPNITTNQAVLRAVAKDTNGSDVEGRSSAFVIELPPPTGYPVARLAYSPTWPQPATAVAFDASASSPATQGGSLEARWDWENDGTWDTTWSFTLTAQHAYAAQGNYTAHLEVRDGTATDNATTRVVVDGTPPRTTASIAGTPVAAGWYQSNASVSLAATDALSGVASTSFRLDGGTWQTYSGPVLLADGLHDLDFYSVDRAGVAETAHTLTVGVGPPRPIFQSVSPQGIVTTSRVLVSWTVWDPLSLPVHYTASVDGGPFVDNGENTSLVLVLADGSHSITIRAVDQGGNVSETTIAFRVDTNPFSFTGPYSGFPTVGAIVVAGLAASYALLRRRRSRRRKRLGQEPPG